jgi:hypothetical protein
MASFGGLAYFFGDALGALFGRRACASPIDVPIRLLRGEISPVF